MNVATIDRSGAVALYDRTVSTAPTRRQWGRALAALRKLLRDNDDTVQVFEIMRALNHGSARKGYLKLLKGPTGARLAYEHVEFSGRLMDDAWLDSFAEGTVGATYREFVRRERLSAEGLAQVSAVGVDPELLNSKDPVAWYGRRIRDVHDLWHITTGYGRDPLGEACLVAFSFVQTRGLGWLAIALGAFFKGGSGIPGVRGAILEGFRGGRAAAWMPGVDYERLMRLPVESARAELGIRPPVRYQAVVAKVRASMQ